MPNAADISRGKALWLYALHVLHVSPALLHVIDHFCPHSWKPNGTGTSDTGLAAPGQGGLFSPNRFPVKGWPCSWRDPIIPRWLNQVSGPSRSPGTHSRRNTEIYFSGSIRNCIQEWLLEPRDMFMWAWIPVYSSIFFCNKISFQCGKNKQINKKTKIPHQCDRLFCNLISSCILRMDLLSSRFPSENTYGLSSSSRFCTRGIWHLNVSVNSPRYTPLLPRCISKEYRMEIKLCVSSVWAQS